MLKLLTRITFCSLEFNFLMNESSGMNIIKLYNLTLVFLFFKCFSGIFDWNSIVIRTFQNLQSEHKFRD